MERSGILDALDEVPGATFGEMRASVVPPEDLDLMQRCGIDDAQAEIEIVAVFCRTEAFDWWPPRRRGLESTQMWGAPDALRRAAGWLRSDRGRLPPAQQEAQPKKRKVFNGIGKILSGAVAGAGKVLLVAGTMPLHPSYGAIASSAIAVGSIFQGIGDLRGE